ncbi:PREDICTED: uncharacterized protein LOC101293912 [Fragaria vesca subsp. vesca]|uniref:uncharacterized protein LOC101293912 n=1 Tax=Fragaria vesca subsp. vesca TaxID=101020 RepID=UPI0002C35945|nr:PREDICTED: uncharacterized protein LOC101293912 [Fragaria vesca subsp. vesca]
MLKNVSKFVQSLPSLEKLDLNCLRGLEYVFGCHGWEKEQSRLREMHLMDLDALKRICSGPAPHAMFKSLKFLTIYRCKLLQSLFASDVAQCLFQLEDLLVEDCPLLKKVMEEKEKTVLPKLKNLVLKNLPMLYRASDTTVDIDIDIECPSLEQLMVVDCPMLPFSTSSVHLRSLESRNKILFSTASNYFGSTYPVQLNDIQLYQNLQDRTSGFQA